MKSKIILILLTVVAILFNFYYVSINQETVITPYKTYYEPSSRDIFLDSLGKQESGNRYDIVNKYGMLGKYQFSYNTLKGLGYKGSRDKFIKSPIAQEVAMLKLLKANKKTLSKQINQYSGKYINNIKITESGLLAAAHLAGAHSVKKWLYTNGEITRIDGFGTSIEKYLYKFGNFNLHI
jgi:hypothetical protein